MYHEQHRSDIQAGRKWVKGMDRATVFELGDQFVLGYFDWRDWGFESKPSPAFLRGADEERISREEDFD